MSVEVIASVRAAACGFNANISHVLLGYHIFIHTGGKATFGHTIHLQHAHWLVCFIQPAPALIETKCSSVRLCMSLVFPT